MTIRDIHASLPPRIDHVYAQAVGVPWLVLK